MWYGFFVRLKIAYNISGLLHVYLIEGISNSQTFFRYCYSRFILSTQNKHLRNILIEYKIITI